jgi:hypothetical protein
MNSTDIDLPSPRLQGHVFVAGVFPALQFVEREPAGFRVTEPTNLPEFFPMISCAE